MWIFVFIGGLIVPRITIAFLYLFTTWFNGVFETRAWPILGFLFMPLTLLWYSLVEKMMAGEWNWWQVGITVALVLVDLGVIGKSSD